MANKDLFKQAIAEAKSVRAAAIANAKEALEETLTPHLKDMLAAKLQEMEDSNIEEAPKKDDKTMEEAPEKKKDMKEAPGDKEKKHMKEAPGDKEKKHMKEAPGDKDKKHMEAKDHDNMDEAHGDEEHNEAKHDKDEAMEPAHEKNEAEDDSVESEDDAEVDEPKGDEDISDLSVDQFKDLIRDIINQEMGDNDAPAMDMDAGDIEGMGDEPDAVEEPMDMPGEDEEEIDLDELIRELENSVKEEELEEFNTKPNPDNHRQKADVNINEDKDGEEQFEEAEGEADKIIDDAEKEALSEVKSDLAQALETINTLKSELNEVNILNSKLLYVNKIFKSNDLSESQKVNIIAAFDKAETVKEVKLVYETVSDNVVSKKEAKHNIKEAKTKLGMASKATGTTASKPEVITEVSETVRRMQKLAGIIK